MWKSYPALTESYNFGIQERREVTHGSSSLLSGWELTPPFHHLLQKSGLFVFLFHTDSQEKTDQCTPSPFVTRATSHKPQLRPLTSMLIIKIKKKKDSPPMVTISVFSYVAKRDKIAFLACKGKET